jgi:hypothetical protein
VDDGWWRAGIVKVGVRRLVYEKSPTVDLQEKKHCVMQKLSAALFCWIVGCPCMEKPHSRENSKLENS